MATGIVSAALRQDGLPGPSAVLLAIAAVSFVILVSASCWRGVAFPADMAAGLRQPDRAFEGFAFVAACAVLGNGLAGHRQGLAAAVLAGAALIAWLALTCLIPVRLAARRAARPVISQVNGTWYLWAVATQSLAIAAAFLQADGLLPPGPAASAGIAAWSLGVIVYLAAMILIVVRVLAVGIGRAEATGPYWVAMGAASISVFAATQILRIPGPLAAGGGRIAVIGAAVVLWVMATALVPVLAALTATRCAQGPWRARYRPSEWAVVFPLGMYAIASLQLASTAGLPLSGHIGAAAVWVAAGAWALTFGAMLAAPFSRSAGRERPAARRPKPASRTWHRRIHSQRPLGTTAPAKRYRLADVLRLPAHPGELHAAVTTSARVQALTHHPGRHQRRSG